MPSPEINLHLRRVWLPVRAVGLRLAAGWDPDPVRGWTAPCGTTEAEWLDAGYPLPEDADFAEWFTAFHHYDALDADAPPPNPYPNAPAQAGE